MATKNKKEDSLTTDHKVQIAIALLGIAGTVLQIMTGKSGQS